MSTTIDVEALAKLPAVQELDRQVTEIHNAAVGVSNQQEADEASALLRRIRAAAKAVEDTRTSITQPMVQAQRAVNAFFKGPLDALAERQKVVTRALQVYQEEQRRIASEARAKAEAERAAEVARLQRIADANRRMGAVDAAAKVETQAAVTGIVPVARAKAPTIDGFHERTVWDFEVTSLADVPREFLRIDEAKLAEVARTAKDQANVPGVRFFARKVGVVR